MFTIIKRILSLSGDRKGRLIRGIIDSIINAVLIKVPLMLILFALIKIESGSLSMTDIWLLIAILVIALSLAVFFNYRENLNQMGTGNKMFADERLKLGDRIKRFSLAYFTEGNIGNLSAVVTSDIIFIEDYGTAQIGKVVSSFMSLVVTLVFLFFLSIEIGLIALVITCCAIIILLYMQKMAKNLSADTQEKQKDVAGNVIEFVKGLQVIKAFNLVGDKQRKTNDSFDKLMDSQISFESRFTPLLFLINALVAIAISATILFSGLQVINGQMDLAFGIMLVIFSFEIFQPISVISSATPEFRIMEAALDRYEAILETEVMPDTEEEVPVANYDIEFNDVSFSYEDEQVIKNVGFKANGKEMTALVGKSGCGKTTITSLIARFWDIDSGEILIGGVDIREMAFEQLMSMLSVVFQDVYLFNDTILNNIAFGKKNATKEEVIEAAKKARCYDFIMKYKDGFNTVIGEGGASLSGGEKQRISIARAILKDAPIVLLDEATASVDPDNEAHIQEAINELIAEKTLIVIAHKLSTIKNADNIIVIEDGRVIDSGDHNELIGRTGLYKSLWEKRQRSKTWKIEREVI